jgi:hypothetical protein
MKVFIDTCTVNYLLDLDGRKPTNATREENEHYLRLLRDGPVKEGAIQYFVNPTIQGQINATPDEERKTELTKLFEKFNFTDVNMTVFPFTFPATFISDKQAECLERICDDHPSLKRDEKIIADGVFNSTDRFEVILTTDENLAKWNPKIEDTYFMTPKQLYEYTQSL